MAFGAPSQHAAGEVGDVGEAGVAENDGCLRRAAAGAAYRHDRPVMRQFAGAFGQRTQRDQGGAADMPERPGELLRLADVDYLDVSGMLFEPVRVDFPDPSKAIA